MERITYLTGMSKHHKQMDVNPGICETGYVVYRINFDGSKTSINIDMGASVTLKRMASLLPEAEALTENEYSSITIYDNIFNADGRLLAETHYTYNKAKNRLVIYKYDRGMGMVPVYENYNGVICKDLDALADCLL